MVKLPIESVGDVEKIRCEAAGQLYDAAVQFTASLDQWRDYHSGGHHDADLAYCQHQKRITLAFLYRLFPDRAADIARIVR